MAAVPVVSAIKFETPSRASCRQASTFVMDLIFSIRVINVQYNKTDDKAKRFTRRRVWIISFTDKDKKNGNVKKFLGTQKMA